VKTFAVQKGLELYQPPTLRAPEAQQRLRAVKADALVVAAYGLILPPPALEAARHGAINVHASLLPRWRGAAPIQRALLAGDSETGVSIMQMNEGLDTGPVFAERRVPIAADDDAGTLHDELAARGAGLLLAVLDDIAAGRAHAQPQSANGVTYAHKIDKAETQLRWERPAVELERAVRAFRPAPGAMARFAEQPMKIWRARVVDGHGEPGVVLAQTDVLTVACGNAALAIEELQPAGGRRMSAAQFARGHRLPPGARLQ
jgi:methionyl-tRNA formyltransferase